MAAPEPSPSILRIAGPIDCADVPGLCAQLVELIDDGADRIVCDVGGLAPPDVVAVDALARLQLTARRFGCRLRLRTVSAELEDLLAFMGLAEAVLRLEVGRQAEEREQRLGVEEERELDDLVP